MLLVLRFTKVGVFGEFLEADQLLDSFLLNNDYYLLTVDWPSYLDAQERVDKVRYICSRPLSALSPSQTFKDVDRWTKMSINSTAGSGKFSSDRSIRTYAEKIWDIEVRE